jgi:hypothetical protein
MPAPDVFDERNLSRAIRFRMSTLFLMETEKLLKPPDGPDSTDKTARESHE